MYPKLIDEFTEKLNKLDNNTYVIEEKVNVIDGVYQGELEHDNVSKFSLRVYTGPKLTGDKIENFILTTPSKTPWKLEIKIFSSISPVYITYETQGDTVEARDINKVQESILNTEKALNSEVNRVTNAKKVINNDLNKESDRASKEEQTLTKNLNFEINRAAKSENNITNNLNNEIKRATSVEKVLNDNFNNEVNRAKQSEETLNNSISTTNSNLSKEITRSTKKEGKLNTLINAESSRAKDAESSLNDNINNEINKAAKAESSITNNLNNEVKRAVKSEKNIDTSFTNYKSSNNVEIQKLKEKDVYLDDRKSEKTYVDTELNKRYLKGQVFTKEEVLKKIQDVIGTAPEALDTLEEIARALNNNKDFATTITNELSKKVDKIQGKQLSAEDYTSTEKNKLARIQDNANKYIHPSTHSANMIIENKNKRFASDSDKNKWNTVTNKAQLKHKHVKADITDFPKSLLANGGNADTVDGKHADDFVYNANMSTNLDLNTIIHSGIYRLGNHLSNAPEGAQYGQLLVMHGAGDTATQIVTSYNSNNIFWRGMSNGHGWYPWREIWHNGNFNPEDMVSKHYTWNNLRGV